MLVDPGPGEVHVVGGKPPRICGKPIKHQPNIALKNQNLFRTCEVPFEIQLCFVLPKPSMGLVYLPIHLP